MEEGEWCLQYTVSFDDAYLRMHFERREISLGLKDNRNILEAKNLAQMAWQKEIKRMGNTSRCGYPDVVFKLKRFLNLL